MTFLNPFGFFVVAFVVYLFGAFIRHKERGLMLKQTKLLGTALFFLALAFTRPALSQRMEEQNIQAGDFIIALDVSYSMLADDVRPSRFAVARENIVSLLQKMPKDRFSIFVFTSNALLISPPTTDSRIAVAALKALNPEYILTKSTSLGSLLDGIAKFNEDAKELIIFTDGGEERDIAGLVKKAKKARVKIDIVAIGSKKGTVLKRNGEALVDANQKLVVSRINPLLRTLAEATGGFYMELNGADDISGKIQSELQSKAKLEIKTQIHSYKELYVVPLVIAFVVLLLAYMKAIEYIRFLSVLLVIFSYAPLEASVFSPDGFALYEQKRYKDAAEYFLHLRPSKESYYNAAVAYYKAGLYKKALTLFSAIKTKAPLFKAKVFYNMANCAVGLRRYDRTIELYKKALALNPDDKEAKENLLQLYMLGLKKKIDVADMMPHVQDRQSTLASRKNETKQDEKNDTNRKNASNRQQSQSASSGAGSEAKKSSKNEKVKLTKQKMKEYKFGYSAYELINKGYINETHPW